MSQSINQAAWYSRDTIFSLFGIDPKAIDQATRAGLLKPNAVGHLNTPLYKGADLIQWLDNGAPTGGGSKASQIAPRVPAAPNRACQNTETTAASGGQNTGERTVSIPNYPGGACAEFDRRVRALMEERTMSRQDAVAAVCKGDPVLHRSYLAEANERAGNHGPAEMLRREAARLAQ